MNTTIHELPLPHLELLKFMILVCAGVYFANSLITILNFNSASTPHLCTTLGERYYSYGTGPTVGTDPDAKK
jgi:hypothetical protein